MVRVVTSRAPAGFTLVELTITLVVLGISAGLVIPALSGLLGREGEKSTARILTGVLRRARSEAILTGRPWRVDLDWTRGECRLSPNEPPPVEAPTPTAAARDAAKTRTPTASPSIDAALAAKKVVSLPPVKLPGRTHPRLAMTSGQTVDQPEVTTLVVRPEGLCQPAFIRLPGTDGVDAAVTVASVGCRVELASDDLDTAQTKFKKALGLVDPPWARTDSSPAGR